MNRRQFLTSAALSAAAVAGANRTTVRAEASSHSPKRKGKRPALSVWSHPEQDYGKRGKASVRPMVDRLAEAGFELIIPLMKTEGPVSYQSKIGNMAEWCKDWDPLETMANEANRAGMKLHPWLCVFRESEGSALLEKHPEVAAVNRPPSERERERMAARRRREGTERRGPDWACPRAPEVQDYEASLYEELMGYDVAGVHLDYIRYGSRRTCYCERCRSACQEAHGFDPTELERTDSRTGDWLDVRAQPVTRFVERMRGATRAKGKELSAAVFTSYPSCYEGQGQDWVDWAERGLVDLMLPMNYSISTKVARRRAQAHVAFVNGKVPLSEGLGKSSSMSQLPTKDMMAQAEACLAEGADGICLFVHHGVTDEDLAALKRL